MGLLLWTGAAAVALVASRFVHIGRRRWIADSVVALIAAAAFGLAATIMDFGGWNEPDLRAGVFVLFGAFASIGLLRAIRTERASQTE